MSSNSDKKWYHHRKDGTRIGPVSLTRWHVEWGYLTPSTLVWTHGQADWVRADQTELASLFADVELPPPLPGASHPDSDGSGTPPPSPATASAASERSDRSKEPTTLFGVSTDIWMGFIGIALILAFTLSMLLKPQQADEAVAACRRHHVAGGLAADAPYDWGRGYLRDPYEDTNMPTRKRVSGLPIKCVMIPKVGADSSGEACGLLFQQPKDHLVCRMVYDPAQDLWLRI